LKKLTNNDLRLCAAHIVIRQSHGKILGKILGCATWLRFEPLEAGIMNPQRSAQALGLFQIVVVAGWIVAWFTGVQSAGIQDTGAALLEDRRLPSLAAAAELVDAPRATVVDHGAVGLAANGLAANGLAAVDHSDVVMATEPVPGPASDRTVAPNEPKPMIAVAVAASSRTQAPPAPPLQVATLSMAAPALDVVLDEPKSVIEMAPTDASQMPPPAAPPVQLATASTPDPVPNDAIKAGSRIGIPDPCPAEDACIDRYLWAFYERTPKEDSIKVEEQRKVTVKKRGKSVTVTRSFTRLVDEDFAWKDPKAAERAGLPMMDYVVGGMDRSFRLKLFNMLRAAEAAGLSPGITSAFRDDYRQAIASGLKAASDRSYHGGSSHGGYGHGLAADVVSIKGETRDQRYASSEALWKWIDTHGEEFGIGRPYLDRDPPHVAPIDGKEYASHHGTKTQHAASDAKKRNRIARRDEHNAAKHPKAARLSKVRTI
jgi:hypothetical protein